MPADPPGGTTVSVGDDDYVAVNRSLVVTLRAMNDDLPSPRYIVSDSSGLVVNDGGVPSEGGHHPDRGRVHRHREGHGPGRNRGRRLKAAGHPRHATQ